MPEAMSDERLAEVRSVNEMRKSIEAALLSSLVEGLAKEQYQALQAGNTIDELLAEVERLRRCDDQTSVTHELRDRMAADRIKELEAENADQSKRLVGMRRNVERLEAENAKLRAELEQHPFIRGRDQ